MSMREWAKREVEIACKRERGDDSNDDEWDYGCACYESALKAYESLLEDGHSGMSIGITKQILNRLIDGKPLTPIEDHDDIWNDVSYDITLKKSYQCKRMSSLFKDVYPDGTVKYHDVNRFVCVDVHDKTNHYNSGLVKRIMHELLPITMPYYPGPTIEVICEEFLTDERNGDYDTVGVLYYILPDGTSEPIDRYFKEGTDDWEEISLEEYINRKSRKIERK